MTNEPLKPKIQALRAEGKTYTEIKKELDCSLSTISFHLGEHVRPRQMRRQSRNRKLTMEKYKGAAGGCCLVCQYSRSFAALEFHHADPKNKLFEINDAIRGKAKGVSMKIEDVMNEIGKCILLCANCHREVHDGTICVIVSD